MIRTVTILSNVLMSRVKVMDVVRGLNRHADTVGYTAVSKGQHIYNVSVRETGEFDITVTGYMDGGDCSDSLLLESARAACFPVLVELLAG